MYDEKTKEFDFWVGSWDVRPRGAPTTPPARNDVTKIDDGCVVHESWIVNYDLIYTRRKQ